MRVLILFALGALLITGCSKEEVIVETGPSILSNREIVFDIYGDTQIIPLIDEECLLALEEDYAVVVPNERHLNERITVDYIQGNSLNDWAVAYSGAKGYELVDNSFVDGERYYKFKHNTNDNTWVMVEGSVELKNKCDELIERMVMQ